MNKKKENETIEKISKFMEERNDALKPLADMFLLMGVDDFVRLRVILGMKEIIKKNIGLKMGRGLRWNITKKIEFERVVEKSMNALINEFEKVLDEPGKRDLIRSLYPETEVVWEDFYKLLGMKAFFKR